MQNSEDKVLKVIDIWRERVQEMAAERESLRIQILCIGDMCKELSSEFEPTKLHIFTPQENEDADEFVNEQVVSISIQDELDSLDPPR